MFGACQSFFSENERKTEIVYESVIPQGINQPPSREIFSSLLDAKDDIKVEKIVKSKFQKYLRHYKILGKAFVDTQFPPNKTSLGDNVPIKGREVEWRRVTELVPSPLLLEFMNPTEIVQGSLGDCYFLSSISALGEISTRIKNLFGTTDPNPEGVYMVRVNVRGIQKEVIVDDYFPVYSHNKQFVYSKPIRGEDIWVMLLEKVWAKINGSYANIVMGYPHEVLTTFNNAPCFYLRLDDEQKKEEVWKEIRQAKRENFPLCCSSKTDIDASAGIMPAATYPLANCMQVEQNGTIHRIVALRNPWESISYSGSYSDGDHKFWNSTRSKGRSVIDMVDKEGIFYMGFDDFFRLFESLDISHVNPLCSYNFQQCSTSPRHGAYFKVVVKEDCECYFILQQERRNNTTPNNNMVFARMTLVIAKWETDHFSYIDSKLETYFPTLPIRCPQLAPGQYIAYAKCEWPTNLANQLTFGTYSSKVVQIERAKKQECFIKKVMTDYALRRGERRYLDHPLRNEWISLELLYNQGGYAYIFAYVEAGSGKKIQLQCNREEFEKCGLKIKHFKGEELKLAAKQGEPQIIVCRVLSSASNIVFPPSIKISRSL